MGQMIVNVIFSVLNFIGNVFLGPIFNTVASIIPEFTSFFTYIMTFLNYGFQYISFFVKLLMIPTAPLVIVVGLWVGIFAFNLTIRVVGMGMAIYHYFKP